MKQKSSKRITLGTYSKNGLYNSFDEGQYDFVGGLEQAIKDARMLLPKDGKRPHYMNVKERGYCVAVFRIGMAEPRILVKYPWCEGSPEQ